MNWQSDQRASYLISMFSKRASWRKVARRAQNRLSEETVASWITRLQDSQTMPDGLPDVVLVQALNGYGGESLSWPELRSKAQQFQNFISVHGRDCTIRLALRRPGSGKSDAASISLFMPVAAPLRQSKTLFGANIHTFTFWPSRLWVLSSTDPLYTTDHLHQRLRARTSRSLHEFASGLFNGVV